jgi:ABC-type Na+ transport system ATPase subunit NatA
VIRLDKVTKTFGTGVSGLEDITFTVERGEKFVLFFRI